MKKYRGKPLAGWSRSDLLDEERRLTHELLALRRVGDEEWFLEDPFVERRHADVLRQVRRDRAVVAVELRMRAQSEPL